MYRAGILNQSAEGEPTRLADATRQDGALLSISARNLRPNSRSWPQWPSAVTHSPALTEAREPTKVTRSRWPLADLEDAETAFLVMERDALDQPGEARSWSRW